MANPAWIQIMTTMRKRVFHGALSSHCCGVEAEPDQDLVEQADLRGPPVGPVVVDELPDDRRADERDGHRQEDQRLGEGLDPRPCRQHGVDQADGGRHERRDQDPDRGVAQDDELVGVGEDGLVVVEADEARCRRVLERLEDRADGRVDQADRQHDQGRADERAPDDPVAAVPPDPADRRAGPRPRPRRTARWPGTSGRTSPRTTCTRDIPSVEGRHAAGAADADRRQVRPPVLPRPSGLRPGGLDLVDGVLRALARDPGRRLLPEGVRARRPPASGPNRRSGRPPWGPGGCRTTAGRSGWSGSPAARPLLALTQPPPGVALAFSFAQVSEER